MSTVSAPATGRQAFRVNATAQLLRVAGQAMFFVLLARLLGASDYGAFAAAVALAAIASPFAGIGRTGLLIRNVSRDAARAGDELTTSTAVLLVNGTLAATLLAALSPRLIGHSITSLEVLLIALSDLAFVRVSENVTYLFQALRQPGQAMKCSVTAAAARLAALVAVALLGDVTLLSVSLAYFTGGLLAGFEAHAVGVAHVGSGRVRLRQVRAELGDGALFSIGMSAQTVYNDVDKAMLTKIAGPTANGVYTAAYRIVDLAFVPVRAALQAAYPRFFVLGERAGAGEILAFGRRLLKPLLGYGVVVSVGLLTLAPIVPMVLGDGFENAVGALRGLAILPILRVLHYVAADTLTGIGRQGRRTAIQALVAAMNVGLNLWLIPRYGWQGAVGSSVVSDAALAVGLWLCVVPLVRMEKRVEHR
jgi:O-antigen/teichoic acid export membrane protein